MVVFILPARVLCGRGDITAIIARLGRAKPPKLGKKLNTPEINGLKCNLAQGSDMQC